MQYNLVLHYGQRAKSKNAKKHGIYFEKTRVVSSDSNAIEVYDCVHARRKLHTMTISEKRLEEIRAFKEKEFSDSPVLTDEQLFTMKPCHLVNKTPGRCEKTDFEHENRC